MQAIRMVCPQTMIRQILQFSARGLHPSVTRLSANYSQDTSFKDLGIHLLQHATKNSGPQPESDEISEDVNLFVIKTVDLLKQRSGPDYTVSPNLVRNLKNLLSTTNMENKNYWLKMVQKRPEFFLVPSTSFHKLEVLHNVLLVKFCISKKTTFSLMTLLPTSLIFQTGSVEDIDKYWCNVFSMWAAFCEKLSIDNEDIFKILLTMPEIIMVDPEQWENRLETLAHDYFKDYRTLKPLFLTAGSSIMLDTWESLTEKLDYLITVMHVDIKDLANSGFVLLEDLNNIKARFMFLERAGLYIHPSPKSLGTSKSAYPNIGDIFRPNDEDFVKEVAGFGLTLDEFKTFVKILESEELIFEKPESKSWFSEVGYEDQEFNEDLEQLQQFQDNHDKNKLA